MAKRENGKMAQDSVNEKEDFKNKAVASYNLLKKEGKGDVLFPNLIRRLGLQDSQKSHIMKLFNVDSMSKVIKACGFNYNETNGKQIITYEEKDAIKGNDKTVEDFVAESPKKDRIIKVLEYLNDGLYEKEEAVRLALLCAVAGESIFFLGPPGVAKSLICRKVSSAFSDGATYYEHLMSEFTTPEEVFGPVSLIELQKDNYTRKTKGYLPQSNIAFLDEIWKSGPAILNTLLTLINEKKFHNGNEVLDVPLILLLSASNELPQKDRGLDALFDRFIIRLLVDGVKDDKKFLKVALLPSGSAMRAASDEERAAFFKKSEIERWSRLIDNVNVGENVQNVILGIKKELIVQNEKIGDSGEERFYVSDRRWKKIVKVLRTSAFLCERDKVDLMDCFLIEYCIWNTIEQRKKVMGEDGIVARILKEYGLTSECNVEDLVDGVERFKKRIDETWYEEKITDKEYVYKTIEGYNCYKCKDDDDAIHYITVDRTYNYNNYHFIYNSSFQREDSNASVSIDEDTDTITYNGRNYTMCTIPAQTVLVKRSELFNNSIAYDATKTKFNEDCDKIAAFIEKEKILLNNKAAPDKEEYEGNLFVKREYAAILLKNISDTVKQLDDVKVLLEKERARYAKN